jgi:hypothetical protein
MEPRRARYRTKPFFGNPGHNSLQKFVLGEDLDCLSPPLTAPARRSLAPAPGPIPVPLVPPSSPFAPSSRLNGRERVPDGTRSRHFLRKSKRTHPRGGRWGRLGNPSGCDPAAAMGQQAPAAGSFKAVFREIKTNPTGREGVIRPPTGPRPARDRLAAAIATARVLCYFGTAPGHHARRLSPRAGPRPARSFRPPIAK